MADVGPKNWLFTWSSGWWFQRLVLIGQVKQYFAYETQHQHGAFAMTGGFKDFLCSPLFGEDSHFDSYFSNGLKPPTRVMEPL